MSSISGIQDLDQMEIRAVLEVAKELVYKNRVVKIEVLFNIAKRRLKLKSLGLKLILKYLFENKILVEGSKIIKSEVLSNEMRALIYKFIQKYPGVNFSALKNNLTSEFDEYDIKMGTGQLIWHVEILMKYEFLRKIEFKKYTLYFPYIMDPEHAKYYFLLRDQINRKIIKTLIEKDSLKQADIPNIINELKGSVYYHIKSLKKENILNSETRSGALEVWLNQEKRALIIEILDEIEQKLSELKEKYNVKKVEDKEDIEEKIEEEQEDVVERELIEIPEEKEKPKKRENRIKLL
ncbi:MAG: hypothetical protein ACFFBP_22735 [Promethearchaeota archaeon]